MNDQRTLPNTPPRISPFVKYLKRSDGHIPGLPLYNQYKTFKGTVGQTFMCKFGLSKWLAFVIITPTGNEKSLFL
jgi:hypothetical protein